MMPSQPAAIVAALAIGAAVAVLYVVACHVVAEVRWQWRRWRSKGDPFALVHGDDEVTRVIVGNDMIATGEIPLPDLALLLAEDDTVIEVVRTPTPVPVVVDGRHRSAPALRVPTRELRLAAPPVPGYVVGELVSAA